MSLADLQQLARLAVIRLREDACGAAIREELAHVAGRAALEQPRSSMAHVWEGVVQP